MTIVRPKHKFIFLTLIALPIFITLFLPACSTEVVAPPAEEEQTEIENQEPEKPLPPLSPYTGVPTEEELLLRPLAVVINNHREARPQMGLQEASLVYEMLCEGEITRFLAIFPHALDGDIGPVRSARLYFAYLARENDAVLAHVGSSSHAEDVLRKKEYDHLDEQAYSRFFHRVKDRRAPHNLYTNINKLVDGAHSLKLYRDTNQPPPFTFKAADTQGPVCKVEVPFNNYNQITYTWSDREHAYLRSINNEPHLDARLDRQIIVNNIIVQYVPVKFFSTGNRDYSLMGQGEGLLISAGQARKIRWEKDDYSQRTKFFLEDGSALILSPGNTWIHILSPNKEATYTEKN